MDGPTDLDDRLAMVAREDLAVVPFQPGRVDEHLGDGLLDRPLAGEGRDTQSVAAGEIDLAGGEDTSGETRRAFQCGGETARVDEVDADADDPSGQVREQDYSTVTDLARLRGWSTSWPLAVAISHAKTCSGTVETSGCMRVGTAGTRTM